MERLGQTTTVNARVLDALRAAVVSGELAPGTLHSVQALATQLGVSRTPVREALIKLAQQDMVRFERNRGVRVLQTSVHDLEEVFALRLLLEVPATRRATQLLDDAGRRELRKLFKQMQRAAEADDEYRLWQYDRRFHQALIAASGNTRLVSYVDALRDSVLRQGVSTARSARSLAEIVAEHQDVLERVEAGDADGAAAAMRRHIRRTAELLISQEGGVDVADLALDWTCPG